MNGDSRSTWPNAELHKEIAELQSQLNTRAAELENIKFLAEQAEICHQAELAEARKSNPPAWIQDHTIEISRLKAELAEARHVESEKLCRGLALKLAKTQEQRDELRTQLTDARSKHLHDVLAEQMLNQELRDQATAIEAGWKLSNDSYMTVQEHLRAENEKFRTRIDAAEKDRKRLDWCETNLIITYPSRKAKTFREAIDAAMSAESKDKSNSVGDK